MQNDDLRAEMRAGFENIGTAVKELRASFENIGTAVKELRGDVNNMQDDISLLKGDISLLKEDVSALKGDVSALKGDVNDIKFEIREFRQDTDRRFGEIKAQFTDLVTVVGDVTSGWRDEINREMARLELDRLASREEYKEMREDVIKRLNFAARVQSDRDVGFLAHEQRLCQVEVRLHNFDIQK